MLVSLLETSKTLDKALTFSIPEFPFLKKGTNNSSFLLRVVRIK
jgi:hypothetical protein